jgi:hypothetical protein
VRLLCCICVYDVCALQNRDDRVSFDRYDAAFTRWHYSCICCLYMMHSFRDAFEELGLNRYRALAVVYNLSQARVMCFETF